MAKNVRVSDSLYALAEFEARLEQRSIAQQLEYWARHGMAALTIGSLRVSSIDAAIEASRRLDIADVRDGKRTAESLHFIPKSLAQDAELEFPVFYKA